MQQCLKKNEKIYVKPFPGASTIDMANHARSTQRYSTNSCILHTGSKDTGTNTGTILLSNRPENGSK